MCRDGSTPEQKVKQILSVAPILPGQKPSPTNHLNGVDSKQSSKVDDLIDFGASAPRAAQKPLGPPSQTLPPEPPRESHDLLGLQEPMKPSQPIKRVDTLEGSLDEFVDAEPAL